MPKRRNRHHPARPAPPGGGATLGSVGASPEVDARRGLEAFERGEYDQAIQAWKQAQRAGAPASVTRALAEAHFRRGLAAGSEGRRLQDLHEAVQLRSDSAIYRYHLGLAAQRLGQLRRARDAFEAAYRLEPGNARFQRHLALASLADPAGAQDVRAVLNDETSTTTTRSEAISRLLALAYLKRNDEPAAAVTRLVALTSPSRLTSLALAIAQLAAGQAEAALSNLEKVRRGRQPLGNDAREAMAIASVLAPLGAGNLRPALDALRHLEPPVEPVLRAAFAAVARRLAQELVLEERLDDALLACRQAVAAVPDHPPTSTLLGHLHEVLGTQAARRGDFAAASVHWEAALTNNPDTPRILHNLSLAEERLERWEQASGHWEALGRVWKKELRSLGGDSHATGDLRKRLAMLYRHLATTSEAAGDLHAAARGLESALNFDPSQVDLQLRAAELYLENEDYARAIDHLRRAHAARPNDTRVLADLGSAYDLKGDQRQAQIYLEQALALDPANAAVRATLAGVHHALAHRLLDGGQAARAAVEFERAVELDGQTTEHYVCLGEAHLKLGQLKAAQTVFDLALKLNAAPVRARVTIGSKYLANGFEAEATKLFRQALRMNRAPTTRVAVGLAYLELGKYEQAHEHFRHILKGRDAFANAAIGKLLIDAEREVEAIPYLERAAALDPFDARVLLDLAFAVAFGRADYARAAAELVSAERAAQLSADDQAMPEIQSARRLLNKLVESAALAHSGSRDWETRW